MSVEIPTVDLQDLASEDPAARERAAEALKLGLGAFGLIYVTGHDVDLQARDELYRAFVAFTAQPDELKQPLNRPDLWYQRGWTPPNVEKAVVASGQPDFKECYFCAPLPIDPITAIEYPQICAANVWPEGAQGFRDAYLDLGRALHAAGAALLRGCATALDLAADTFTEAIEGGPHVSRLLRYLPLDQSQVDAGVLWGEEHTDFNVITLLPGGRFLDGEGQFCERPDDHAGLYLRTRPDADHPKGQKVRGLPPQGCLVAQVGQQLEILSGGAYQATPHVIAPPRTPGYSRVSCAHFVHLHSHQTVFPLPPFRSQETLEAYRPPVLAGTYALKTLVDIGLAPKEAIAQLGYRHYARLEQLRAKG